MTLRLSIENVASLTSGDPVEVVLEQHGIVIGRAAHADWTLPDPRNHVSSIHCEIDYQGGRYFLTDRSTNGTFVNGASERFVKPYQLRDGDLVAIGHYQVRVEEVPDEAPADGGGAFATPEAQHATGLDWGAAAGTSSKPMAMAKFGKEPPKPLFQSSSDPLMSAFATPSAAKPGSDPFGFSGGGAFGVPAAPAPAPAHQHDPFGLGGGSPAPVPPADPFGMGGGGEASRRATAPPPAGDTFGLGAPAPAPAAAASSGGDPFGFSGPAPSPPSAAGHADPWAKLTSAPVVDFTNAGVPPHVAPAPVAAPRQTTAAPAPRAPANAAAEGALFERFLAATGIKRKDIGDVTPEAVLDAAGALLRQAADGLIRLLDARTRVRHQFGVGASVTTFQRAGNNPLKWTRSPEQALKQMIGEPETGFLPGDQAVRGAFEDLQAHEMAMIAAMQEAMQATIERFAPDKIKERISARGWLKSVLPGSREATLWRAYETEFRAFADETEAAYLDLFAKHFKKAYERTIAKAG